MVSSIVDGVVTGLQTRITALETENASLKETVAKLVSSCDTAEQYSRRNCIRITGIREAENESTDDHVMSMATALDLDLTINDIDRSHRVGKPGKPRAIIVKFATFRARQKLYRSRSQLKGCGFEGVFVNEDLTHFRSDLLFKARQLCKSGKLDGCWSDNGNILVKDNHMKIHRVSSEEGLNKLSD